MTSALAHSIADALERLLHTDRHPMIRLLEDAPLTVDDIVGVVAGEPLDAESAKHANSLDVRDGLERLMGLSRHPVLLMLQDAPLTVDDILSVPQAPEAQDP